MTEPILELEFEKYEKVIAKQAQELQERDKTLEEKDRLLALQIAENEALKKKMRELESRIS